ncbi:MAG: peptidyl-alpha-hydroxyglycine alpha-amidating lyase family protein [Acidobacteria bacterium]|nr:peptidyl-alpha-hydroxyglycine alpha-amidating lyase family protein [Acidobacteriota bacterium]
MQRVTVLLMLGILALAGPAPAQTPGSAYRVVDNWAQFPDGVTAWSSATGVDIDSKGNIYVFHRNESMPIMAFDRHGTFLRSWGQGLFKTTHFLRTDRDDNVWVTDRGDHQVFKFSPTGELLMTLGKKGVIGDNDSTDAFNGVADLVIAKNGDVFIADGESTNTRMVQYAADGTFVTWWGGLGTAPGQFDEPHSIAIDDDGRLYVGDRRNKRVQVFDQTGAFVTQWTHLGTPWGVFVRDDRLYVVDGTETNSLLIVNISDGTVLERVDGLNNPTAVTVNADGEIFIAEVRGENVRKLVRRARN